MGTYFDKFLEEITNDIAKGKFEESKEPLSVKEIIIAPLKKIRTEIIDDTLKLFEVSFDACGIVLYAKDVEDTKKLLLENDDSFIFKENGDCFYNFGSGTLCEVIISEVIKSRKIISWESH